MRHVLLLIVVVLLAACSKSGTPPAATDVPVRIVATDSGFVCPDTLHSGLNHIVYENSGGAIHECMFIRLPAGMGADDYLAQVKSGVVFPAGAQDCAGPGLQTPGETVEMWVPLEEGNYLLGCWMGGHMGATRPATLVVHGAPTVPVQPPRENVLVRMADFRFELVGKVSAGEQIIRYETMGPSMHEADIVRLEDGKTVDDVRAWFVDQDMPVPGLIAGGTMDSHDLERVTWVKRTFTPGRYLLWCDMPMIQNSEPADPHAHRVTHADAGMFKEFEVE